MPKSQTNCPTEQEIYAYMSGLSKPAAAKKIERHLTVCKTCMKSFTSLARLAAPPAADETEKLGRLKTITHHQRVNHILSAVSEQKNTEKSKFRLFGHIRPTGDGLGGFFRPQLIFAVVAMVIAMFGYQELDNVRSMIYAKRGVDSMVESVTSGKDDLLSSLDLPYGQFKPTRAEIIERDSTISSNLNKALSLDPENKNAHHKLGLYYLLVQKDTIEAKVHLKKAFPKETVVSLLDFGVLAWYKGKTGEAADYFERVLEKDPQNIKALFNLVHCYTRLGLDDKARDVFLMLKRIEPESIRTELAEEVINKT
ncbi:tetratricopeptide repeat protein [candidate division KSB1 bacterium]|nr:tetratricopeptide repeat protein [candidate division KSB1 bacterium]